ncbi:helix-turn-helix transcriptional regulator [Flavobacterium sp. LS1R49]|uniref:Helix-turn-helix transcriptional regulator n=1 Tax=Flavobacterium shii TaxID=2987687 RepID=A0A9X2ZCQ0_9FLAO|nr:helix-turn-helix transcriptional regulator [Flavobacterium shii]MCV9926286.1 helix-turn-helix transcriptional regulator [Flavobacterium shii]
MKYRKFNNSIQKYRKNLCNANALHKNHQKKETCCMGKLRVEDIILRDQIKLRLKELREKSSQNKSDLSKDVEIDRQNFQAWEKLEIDRGMSIYSVSRVCKVLGITLKDFFDSNIFNEK